MDQESGTPWLRLRSPCCGRHLHRFLSKQCIVEILFKMNDCRDCVQTFAMASGVEHFKCPNCNNKELIAKVFQKIGIYVPQKVTASRILKMERNTL